MATSKFTVSARLAATTILACSALVATDSASATQQCVGWVLNHAVPGARVAGAMSGDCIAMARSRGSTLPVVLMHRYDPVKDDYVFEAALDDPGWDTSWEIRHIAMEGDLLAFQPDRSTVFQEACVIGERVGGHWSATTVDLDSELALRFGQLTAVSGDRVVTLTGELNSRFILHVLERSSAGAWSVTDRLVAQGVEPGWFENASTVVLDGDIAAFTMGEISPRATVVIFERDASGTWQQTNLPPPADAYYSMLPGQSLAIDGDRLAVNLRQWPLGSQYVTLIYRRTGPGAWVVEQRIVTEDPGLTWSFLGGSVAMGDGRLALAHFGVTRQFELDAQGRYVVVRSYDPIGSVMAVDANRIAWDYGTQLLIAPAGPGTPERNRLCEKFGYTICDEADPMAPELSIHRNPDPAQWYNRIAEITNGTPGAICRVYVAAQPARRTISAGTLCLDSPALIPLGSAVQLDAFGCATVVMPGSTIPTTGIGWETFYTQALIMGTSPALTNAVRFLFY